MEHRLESAAGVGRGRMALVRSWPPHGLDEVSVGVKALIAAVSLALNSAIYMVPNHLTAGRARQLPWTIVDAAVPFIPETFWVYVSDWFLVASAFFLMRNFTSVARFTRAYFAMLVFGFFFHWFWPTVFPREAWPVGGESLTSTAFNSLRAVDLPTSCFPSMHVAGSYFAAFSLWKHPRKFPITWFVWATLVAISTLTAKQHYAVDVAAGLALALLTWGIFFWVPDRLDQRRARASAAQHH